MSDVVVAVGGESGLAAIEITRTTSDLLDLGATEQTGRHEDENDGEDRERRDVLVLDREIG
jgi:hypothetical protein